VAEGSLAADSTDAVTGGQLHVAAGNVSADSTDAINGGQFFALSSSASTGLNSLSTSMGFGEMANQKFYRGQGSDRCID